MKVGAVILAAGASTRLGEPKQLAKVGGEKLLERALRVCVAAGLRPVVVVLGANAEKILAECDLREARVAKNDSWPEGMASSLRRGVKALAEDAVDAVIVMTCDMPFVDAWHLRALLALAEKEQSDVASAYDDHKGVPALFLKGSFERLAQLTGNAGARSLLGNAPAVKLRNTDDVDTPQALLKAQRAAARIKS